MTRTILLILLLGACMHAADARPPALANDPTMFPWRDLTAQQWKERLAPEAFHILRQSGTERPFCARYEESKAHGPGEYRCAGCDLALFRRESLFTSGTGWPSFTQSLADAVTSIRDESHGMVRVEVRCARCDGHLGHVFDDGPKPTGLRFCINGGALRYVADEAPERANRIIVAGGCFWGMQHLYAAMPGVVHTRVGYLGGKGLHPTYEEICTGRTGHAEAIEVVFDPALTTASKLFAAFFEIHDPTQVDGQGVDIGTQYRSAIFPIDEVQRRIAASLVARIDQSKRLKAPVATRIEAPAVFWPAEDWHQHYLAKNPRRPSCHVHRGISFTDLAP